MSSTSEHGFQTSSRTGDWGQAHLDGPETEELSSADGQVVSLEVSLELRSPTSETSRDEDFVQPAREASHSRLRDVSGGRSRWTVQAAGPSSLLPQSQRCHIHPPISAAGKLGHLSTSVPALASVIAATSQRYIYPDGRGWGSSGAGWGARRLAQLADSSLLRL